MKEKKKGFDIGDVFMQQIYSQVDKKKIAKLRHIAELQAEITRKVCRKCIV